MELLQLAANRLQDRLSIDIRPRACYDRGLVERGQLPPLLPW